jgi:hypothetical protein
VALIKGILASFDDPLLGIVPTIVPFQYNPTEVTRVFQSQGGGGGGGREGDCSTGSALNAACPPQEDYTVKLELDATDGLEKEGPLTTAFGIGPQLAAIEMLMQPVGSSLLGGLAGALTGGLLGGGGAAIPAGRVPLVLFVWGPTRVTPVRLKSLTIHETSFDELLNPIHATADLGFTVLRKGDLGEDDTIAKAAATYYQGAREVKAVLALPQLFETMSGGGGGSASFSLQLGP